MSALDHIQRGPCGGWHYVGWDWREPHRVHLCGACIALGTREAR